MFDFGFVMEYMLGHVTHSRNLHNWVKQDESICAAWMLIEAEKDDIWARLPIVRHNWSLQSSLRARDAIRSTLRTQSLDALFLHTQTIALFSLAFMHQIPTIVSTDATPLNYDTVGTGYQHKVGGNALLERRKFLWNRSTYHAATALITFCEWAKDSLIVDYGIEPDKITVIPSGVDLAQWSFQQKQPSSDGSIRLLFVGGEFARKGGYTLLQAFQSGLSDQCTLAIVTKDATVAQELAGVKNVQIYLNLAANSPQIKELYANSDIFVFPTQADCYPNVIIEAMAAGLPIIATNVGAIREQVEVGINGLLLPHSDPGALAAAIKVLVNDESKRQSMAIASRRLAEERFNGQRNYQKILSLMKAVSEKRMVLHQEHPNPARYQN
ncbi:MAG: glycosyltransferase family 4 protein [Leptolyngbya sp. Prado105]|jgi:glycosyltransferase involved in cell wall biosynthesis|nr:glycosyltransferase family 4 protein [Leptolyngbya sp. Prado105]